MLLFSDGNDQMGVDSKSAAGTMIDKFTITDDVSTLTYYTDYYTRDISKKVCTSLDCLDIKYISGSRAEVCSGRRPCYVYYSYTITVATENVEILEELFILTTPLKYTISQRRGKVCASLNV